MRHVLTLLCLNILLIKASSDYHEEEDEELEDALDDEALVDESVHTQRMKKRAWNSGFTGGLGKRSPNNGLAGKPDLDEDFAGNMADGSFSVPVKPREETVGRIPLQSLLFGKRQWNHQGVRGMWGKRGQRVQKSSWAKSKQHQGVRGSWGKRSPNSAKKIKERGLRRMFGKRKFQHFGGTIWPRWKKADRMHDKRGLNSKHIVKLVNKGSKQRLRGMWGKRESENPEWKAASTRYYLFSSFPWGTEYAPNGAIKSLMKVGGHKRAQSWLQLRGMWGKRSNTGKPIADSEEESGLGTSLDMEDDITDGDIPSIEAEFENMEKTKHKTYRMNPDFGKVRMIPRLE